MSRGGGSFQQVVRPRVCCCTLGGKGSQSYPAMSPDFFTALTSRARKQAVVRLPRPTAPSRSRLVRSAWRWHATRGVRGGGSIRPGEAGEFELHGVETTLFQHPYAVRDGVADRFDPPQRQGFRRVYFHRDVLARQGHALFETEAVGIAAEGYARIFGGGCRHRFYSTPPSSAVTTGQ